MSSDLWKVSSSFQRAISCFSRSGKLTLCSTFSNIRSGDVSQDRDQKVGAEHDDHGREVEARHRRQPSPDGSQDRLGKAISKAGDGGGRGRAGPRKDGPDENQDGERVE